MAVSWVGVAGLILGLACMGLGAQDPKQERMAWWREARFGLFIHWGLYAIPAGEWKSATNHGEWIRETAHIPVDEYEKFREKWNPTKFDAEAWVKLAKDAGMKYVVITSKHHDGFCLFDSAQTDWDVMSTPSKRDVMKELAAACAKYDMKMCWYHSIMDWHHPDYLPRRKWENRPADKASFDRYTEYLFKQVEELLTNYGPIGVMWFDGEWESTWNNELGKKLYALCRKLQPTVIVNNRVSTGRGGMAGMTESGDFPGDFGTPEQEIPAQGLPGVDWETCMTLNDHWGYNRKDEHWKSTTEVIRMLADIASKGGNYLLNVGPTAEGEFPQACVERLKQVGGWMAVNGESIHGTTASPIDAGAWGRVTAKAREGGTTLYLHVFDWPSKATIVLDGLGNTITGARLLAAPDASIGITEGDGRVELSLPPRSPDPYDSVIALELKGAPIVFRRPEIVAPARRFVTERTIALRASNPGVDVRYTLDGEDPTATSPLYTGPFTVRDTTEVRARSFVSTKPVNAVVRETFEKVKPRPAVAVADARSGLLAGRFLGDWKKLPDWTKTKPGTTTTAPAISIPGGEPREGVGWRFSGFITVPSEEVWEFALSSDDGSRLWIDEELVVDNDGLHQAETRRGTIALAAGAHVIRVDYFNRTGGAELSLSAGVAGSKLDPVAPSALSHLP